MKNRKFCERPQPDFELRATIRPLILPLVVLLPGALAAQDSPPSNLAEVEMARSRACVGALVDLAGLEASIEPYTQRVARLNSLGVAVSLEKRQDALPLDDDDPIEAAVASWFSADSVLAVRFLEEGDSTILVERSNAREDILGRMRQSIQEVSAEAQGRWNDGVGIQAAAETCTGAILIRGAVLEQCGSQSNFVCDAARAEDPEGPYRFIDTPNSLWGVEAYGPWSEPAPIQLGPAGELVGASTSAQARIGNVEMRLTLRPLLRMRSELTDEEFAQYQANLDSLGFTFDHPGFAMAPGIDLQGTLPPPLGGETHYLFHFGDLSGDDIIWSMEAVDGGPFRAVLPAKAQDLARLRAGELASLTAIRAPENEGESGEAIFTLSFLEVGQELRVGALLQYLSDGTFEREIQALFPSGPGG